VVAASEPFAELLRVFGEREVLALDPGSAAEARGAAWLRRVSERARGRGDRVVAAVARAGATRDPAEQLLAGEFDLAPIASRSADELRLGAWLAGRERLEFARLAPWSERASRATLHLERAGDAWLRADVGRLSQSERGRAEIWLDGARLGAVRSDFENAWVAPGLAAGAHAVELRSDAPVPALLTAGLVPAHEGLELVPDDPEHALALRARLSREAPRAGTSSALRVLVPTPDPARAAFTLDLDFAVSGDPARAAAQRVELAFGGRAFPSGPLGPGERNEAGERRVSLVLSAAGDELPGDDSELALRLRAPAGSEAAEPRIERLRVQRIPLRDPFELVLGLRDRAFALDGFGAKAELGPLLARGVESRASLSVFFPRGVGPAWLELDYVASRTAEAPPGLRWDGAPLPTAERELRRIELGDGRAFELVRARSALAAAQLAFPIHQLEIAAPPDSARAPLLVHRVRVASERSALDAPGAARGD
jgi:hypothetical protein